MVSGTNFALGKDRMGDLNELKSIGSRMDFASGGHRSETFREDNDFFKPNPARIWQKVRLREANEKLGRHFMLPGKVVHGENRGSKIGFPTANLEIAPERLVPANGVYVTRAWMTESDAMAVTNIGVRPTFDNPLPEPRVEPHLLDTTDDLYDAEITLEFIDFIRPEKKFRRCQTFNYSDQKRYQIRT